jgi:hypothetical protein
MGKKPKRANLKTPGTCLFCRRSPPEIKMSKEHIWSDWLPEILPRQHSRSEGYTTNVGKGATYTIHQGDVGTKKVRVVCTDCNNGWMSQIVTAAKPYAMALISGQNIYLDQNGQRAMANWIGLSALMANQITKSRHKLPKEDIDYYYQNHLPPPHWFVGVGYFVGMRGTSFNHGLAPLVALDTRSGERSTILVKHAFAAILGNLFTLVDIDVNGSLVGRPPPVGSFYAPHIVGIQPSAGPSIQFPPPPICFIVGPNHFWQGTHAWRIARKAIDAVLKAYEIAGIKAG